MTVKVGRLVLAEGYRPLQEEMNAGTGQRSASVEGQESAPPLGMTELVQRHTDLMALSASLTPVVFGSKPDRSGYYRVTDVGATMTRWEDEAATSSWELSLDRVGSDSEVDLESRLSGPLTRQNDHGVTGERIHAPAVGSYAYSAGNASPTPLDRAGSEGVVTVYRNVPVNVHPRWACPVGSYLAGRVRFIDGDGLERSGVDVPLSTAGEWELSNTLVRVRHLGGRFEVSAWSGGAWRPKTWDLRVAGASMGAPVAVTLLRNEPEMIVARLTWTYATGPGRVTADVTLRRGHRLVELWIEAQTSATIRLQRGEAEAAAAGAGYVSASANDAAGNRYLLGSLRAASQDTTNGALYLAGTTTLGLAVGAVVGGSAAAAGDTAANLMSQYAGAPSERVEGVRR